MKLCETAIYANKILPIYALETKIVNNFLDVKEDPQTERAEFTPSEKSKKVVTCSKPSTLKDVLKDNKTKPKI